MQVYRDVYPDEKLYTETFSIDGKVNDLILRREKLTYIFKLTVGDGCDKKLGVDTEMIDEKQSFLK